jgi:hypothetical protein
MAPGPGEGVVVGVSPWLPWPLSRCRWWTEPVRAERLAALRIGLALVLLLDLLGTYLPGLHVFYGRDSLSRPGLFDWNLKPPHWNWSLLRGVEDPAVFCAALAVWVGATCLMLVGLGTRLSVVVVWLLSNSFASLNPYNDNAGDQVRGIILFYLMLCPCGAAWSLDRWLARRRGQPVGPVYVAPAILRLLFLQMAVIYFCNGLAKVVGPDWRGGDSLYFVLNDLTLARWSYAQVPVPVALTRVLTWSVLVWEVGFPLWVSLPGLGAGVGRVLRLRPRTTVRVERQLGRVRVAALLFGVAFHLGILASLELGSFGPYMICLYLPLVPWERWAGRRPPRV